MTPYCTVSHNGKRYKTNCDAKRDKEPVWSDEFKLNVKSATDDVVVRVWDQDMTTPDCIGAAKVKAAKLMQNDAEIKLDLFFGNKTSAIVMIKTMFEPDAGGLEKHQQMKKEFDDQEEKVRKAA